MKLLCLFLVVVVLEAAYAMRIITSDEDVVGECDSEKGEVFKVCGTSCPITCANRMTHTDDCSRDCVNGCFCPNETVRRESDNHCVQPEDCPPVSEDQLCDSANGEVFMRCPERGACPDTCENYLYPNRVCLQGCVPGCTCRNGTVRRENDNRCVKREDCPPPTANNQCNAEKGEVFLSCESACPDTCENYRDVNRPCTQECVIGCGCPTGKVRRSTDDHCVLPTECPSDNN